MKTHEDHLAAADADARSAEWLAELNRAILQSALDCIITMDARGLVREFNPAAERVFGYTRAEAVGRELAELIVPLPLRDRHRAGLAHYLATGEGPVLGQRIEIPALRKDGAEILVELAITAFRIGDEPAFTAYLRDISERVRTERRRAAQYRVADLLASSQTVREAGPSIIQTVAASGSWSFGSIWVREERDDTLHCAAIWHADVQELQRFAHETRTTRLVGAAGLPGQVAASNEPNWIADVLRDGTFVRQQAAAAAHLHGGFGFPLRAEGRVNGVLELFSPEVVQPDDDLMQMVEALGTQIGLFIQRRKLEREMHRQKEAAEAANAAKDRFLANLSHELRTPLTPVLIWAGAAMSDPALPEEMHDDLQMVCRNVELEARLIDDLLDLTRISNGKLQLHLRDADAHELLQHALDIVRSEVEQRKIALEVRLEAAAHQLHVDPARLQQVFWNVLRNAVKFTPDAGAISVRTFGSERGCFGVEIADNGAGIAPEHLENIFNAFEQADSRREGLGLGLAISKAVVEAHGGTIRAASAGTGRGASFVIELPLEQRAAA
ncbi:MAG: PAS domain S-box protein [Verrucomicrobiota bacterium]|nr:PAS domain S-box protein [Verrucomicrobiota bacterium]